MSKQHKDAEKFSKGSAVRHKEQQRDLAMSTQKDATTSYVNDHPVDGPTCKACGAVLIGPKCLSCGEDATTGAREQQFLKWWNENWPDLCPTQIAFAAYSAGRASQNELMSILAENCAEHSNESAQFALKLAAASEREKQVAAGAIRFAVADMLESESATRIEHHTQRILGDFERLRAALAEGK